MRTRWKCSRCAASCATMAAISSIVSRSSSVREMTMCDCSTPGSATAFAITAPRGPASQTRVGVGAVVARARMSAQAACSAISVFASTRGPAYH